MTINYQQARRIRNTSLGSLFADQLMYEGGVIKAAKKTVSLKARAKVKGITEKFDPLNIAKFMTFGSSIGPALLGHLTGRSQKDIQYFTGRSKPIHEARKTAEKIKSVPTPQSTDVSGMNEILVKIYKYMESSHDKEVKRKELESGKREEIQLEEAKRHKEFMDALAKLTGSKSTATNLPPPKDNKPSLFDSLDDVLNTLKDKGKEFFDKMMGKGARIAGETAAKKGAVKAAEKVAAGEAAKTAAKVASKEVVKEVVEKKVVKTGLGSVLKKVPLLGAGVGLLFGVQRAIAGDMKGAALDTASGLAGTIPGVGTVASVGIDVANAARDIYKELYDVFPEDDEPQLRQERAAGIYKEIESLVGKQSSSTPEPTTAATQTRAANNSGVPTAAQMSAAGASMNPKSAQFHAATTTNTNLKLPSASTSTTTVNNNVVNKSGPKTTPIKASVPNVRNNEETFRRLIYNSTRVV